MADVGLQVRDKRGEWMPDPLPAPSPLFSWPLRLRPALRAALGLVWPHNAFYAVIAIVSWLFFTPDLARTGTFALGWIAEIYATQTTHAIIRFVMAVSIPTELEQQVVRVTTIFLLWILWLKSVIANGASSHGCVHRLEAAIAWQQSSSIACGDTAQRET